MRAGRGSAQLAYSGSVRTNDGARTIPGFSGSSGSHVLVLRLGRIDELLTTSHDLKVNGDQPSESLELASCC